jgi:hypothetical protein
VRDLERADDDTVLYFRPPAPEIKPAFAEWVTALERRDRATLGGSSKGSRRSLRGNLKAKAPAVRRPRNEGMRYLE